jgi:hypothetical protein
MTATPAGSVYTSAMTLLPPFFRKPSTKRSLRAIAILLAVLLLHLLAGIWGDKQIGQPADTVPSEEVMTVALETPPAPPKPVPAAPKPPPPKPHPKPPAPRSSPPPPAVEPEPQPQPQPDLQSDSAPPVISGKQGDRQTGGAENGNSADANANANPPPSAPTPAAPPAPAHAADAPPSVTLKYDVQGLRDGQNVYGSGKIIWRNLDGHYRIDGSASVLFFTLLQFSSDGVLDDFGVSPTLYTEKRFHKTATDTRFEHARNTITFSASDNHYPRPGDAQDRASIIWQLAAIGRGNPAAFFTGADFTMFVAGVRDAEPWRITVSGEDEVEAGGDPTSAWHLVRMPQPGSYDQKIDIWLAPQQQWYPVKIRYTETDGDYLEMSLSSRTSP